MIKDDGSVLHFTNPKVQASVGSNTFAIVGHADQKQLTDMLPGILNQLGAESLSHLRRLASNVNAFVPAAGRQTIPEEEDEVPELVGDFDEPSKQENVVLPPTTEASA